MSRPRCLASSKDWTASAEKASAPIPYTVSVGNTTHRAARTASRTAAMASFSRSALTTTGSALGAVGPELGSGPPDSAGSAEAGSADPSWTGSGGRDPSAAGCVDSVTGPSCQPGAALGVSTRQRRAIVPTAAAPAPTRYGHAGRACVASPRRGSFSTTVSERLAPWTAALVGTLVFSGTCHLEWFHSILFSQAVYVAMACGLGVIAAALRHGGHPM